MVDFWWSRRHHEFDILRELALTPGHIRALLAIRADEARPMRSLAEALACDASMATWLVDRLEERGLVERRALATDRRVKTIVLTPLGLATKARFLEQLYAPPAEFLALDTATLKALRDALVRLSSTSRRAGAPPGLVVRAGGRRGPGPPLAPTGRTPR